MSIILPISAPVDWPRIRLQAHFEIFGGGTPAKDVPTYWGGEIPWVSPKDMKQSVISTAQDSITPEAVLRSATRVVPPGSLLLVVRSGILKHSIPSGVSSVPVAINQDMKAFVPSAHVDARFFRYFIDGWQPLLLSLWSSLGATVESLDTSRIKQTEVPTPPLATQRAIANFLDRKTSSIEALVNLQYRSPLSIRPKPMGTTAATGTLVSGATNSQRMMVRQIELLREYRQALITAAVTGQLPIPKEAA